MVTVREVSTRKEQKEFLNFPLKMYRDNPYFVPPLYGDEKKIFRSDYYYYETSEAVYFNAYRDGVMAGRISGILQRASNEKNHEKRVRFTRFDAVDDQEVADALFGALEDWAKKKGMDTVCGPLGFSDLEREGLLIEGFDQLATFEEQYNAEYYGRLIENCGYQKEVDWLESKIMLPDEEDGQLEKMETLVMKRYHLHFGPARSVRDFIRRYGDPFFALLDTAYADLYGTVPITPAARKNLEKNFLLIIDLNHVAVILDENDELVALGLCFPSIAKAVQKSSGHLTPAALVRLLRAIRHPKILDLGLIAVSPEYINRGVSAVICAGLKRMLREDRIEWAETNLNLEDNYAILNQWRRFRHGQVKRYRSYVKHLSF